MSELETALVLKAQKGDQPAFEELVRRTSRLLFARLYLETGHADEAEDLLQETLLRAFRGLSQLSEPGQLRTWLLTIAQNVVIDAARSQARQKRAAPPRVQAGLSTATGKGSPVEEAEQAELRGQVLAALRSLPEEYRLPLTMRYLGGADYETIATQLGLTNGSLRGFLHRGLKMLRSRLGELET